MEYMRKIADIQPLAARQTTNLINSSELLELQICSDDLVEN